MSTKRKKSNKKEYAEIEKKLKEKYDNIKVPEKLFDMDKFWARVEEEKRKS